MATEAQAVPANRIVPPTFVVGTMVDIYVNMRDSNIFFSLIAKVCAFVIAFIPVVSWYFSAELAARDTEIEVRKQLPAPGVSNDAKRPDQVSKQDFDQAMQKAQQLQQQFDAQKIAHAAAVTKLNGDVTNLTGQVRQAQQERDQVQAAHGKLAQELATEKAKATDLQGRINRMVSHASPGPDGPSPAPAPVPPTAEDPKGDKKEEEKP